MFRACSSVNIGANATFAFRKDPEPSPIAFSNALHLTFAFEDWGPKTKKYDF